MGFCRGSVVAAAILLPLATAVAEEPPVADRRAGLEVVLPDGAWGLKDLSAGLVVCRVYAPAGSMVPRVALLRYPGVYLMDGMRSRRAQIERGPGTRAERLRFEPVDVAGHRGEAYEYRTGGVRSVERGFLAEDDRFHIVQVVAPEADWQDPEKARRFERVFESARRLDSPADPALRVDPKTPAEVRAARAPLRESLPYAIRDHDVRVDLWPAEERLKVVDRFIVEATERDLDALDLVTTHVRVTGVFEGDTPLAFTRRNERVVGVTLGRPLAKGERRGLRFEADGAPFAFHADQRLVEEISMLGQVDATSSFSSHVLYYPVDPANDAPVRLALSVPAGYVGVSGGDAIGVEDEGERRVFRYAFPQASPRALPLGFAAARYAEVSAQSAGGLRLTVHHLDGHDQEARQRLDVARECADLFERRMGPLPWKRVALCEVVPRRKEMGVSLPGLVLLSQGFFGDLEGHDLDSADLTDPGAKSLLLVPDELSHQWNYYAVSLPNELAEGVATFTDLLYIEAKKGAGEYREGLRWCAGAYLATVQTAEDVAVADPKLYRSDVYRVTAFCKVAAVLDLLRQRLGDESFFRAWKHVFTSLRGRPVGYQDVERAFSESAAVDLAPFFDQWLHQAGYPVVRLGWKAGSRDGGATLEATFEQVQPGGLFSLDVPLEVECGPPGERVLVRAPISKRSEVLSFPLPSPVRAVRADPEGTCPLLRIQVAAPRRGVER